MHDAQPAITHEDLLLLARWLESDGATAYELIPALEKPWNWRDEIEAARLLFGALVKVGWTE